MRNNLWAYKRNGGGRILIKDICLKEGTITANITPNLEHDFNVDEFNLIVIESEARTTAETKGT